MKKLKRFHLTLIELLIAMTLAILLISTLGYFYREVAFLNRQSKIEETKSFKSRYLETRLMQIIPNTQREYHVKNKGYFFFFTEPEAGQPSLTFIYQAGVDLKPENSEYLLAKLFLNKQQQLCLATWISPDTWDMATPIRAREEILAENIEKLEFAFYNPPERQRAQAISQFKETKGIEPERKGEWLSGWRNEYRFLPPMMKMMISKKEEETVTYAFPLPNSSRVILYE